MIKHIVMFKLKAEVDGKSAAELAKEAQAKAQKLIDLVPTLAGLSVVCNSPSANPQNYEIALICDFETMDDLNAYQVHPEHVAFGQYITPLREARACIDYEY